LRKEVNHLGRVIGKDDVKPNSLKVLAVKEYPRTNKNMKQFLGLVGYNR